MVKYSVWSMALACVFSAALPASSLTTEDLWEKWQDHAKRTGFTLNAQNQIHDGDTLVLADVRLSKGDQENSLLSISEIKLAETPDGGVTLESGIITLPALLQSTGADLRPDHSGLKITIYEAGDGLEYDFSADSFQISHSVPIATTPQGLELKQEGNLEFRDVTGNYIHAGQGIQFGLKVEDTLTAAKIVSPETGKTLFQGQGLTPKFGLELSIMPPGHPDTFPDDGTRAIPNLLNSVGSLTLNQGRHTGWLQLYSKSGFHRFDSNFSPMTVSLKVGDHRFDANIALKEHSEFGLKLPNFSKPLRIDIAASSFSSGMAYSPKTNEGTYKINMNIPSVDLNNDGWKILDPEGVFPRLPTSVNIDTSGLFSPPCRRCDPARKGFLVKSAKIHALEINALGAKLTGQGAFQSEDVNLKATQTENLLMGLVGQANFELRGGNSLLDQLVTAGILPSENATKILSMLSLISTSEKEGDVRALEVEQNSDGALFLNKQQIR